MSKSKKEKVQINFVGEAAHTVTGSCYHIVAGEKQYLIECGMYQSVKSPWENYCVNTKKYPFKAKKIDAIFVQHMHIDHCGNLPVLYAHHCTAPIYIPKGNIELLRILLEDCAFISERDSEAISLQRGKYYPPLYTINDVNVCMSYVREVDFDEIIQVDEQTTMQFVGSAHILNAAQLILKTKVDNTVKTIGYSSDLGNVIMDNRYVSKFTPIKKCDVFISESTYANCPNGVTKKDRIKDLEKLESVIRETCVDKGGRILIPCFASSRTQSVVSFLYDIFGNDKSFKTKIIIDSPMACKITRLYETLLQGEELEYYKKVLSWENLLMIEDNELSREWRDSTEPCVVCSASGMLTAGRSLGWLGKLLPSENNNIIFVGYIPTEGGVGIKIKEGKQKTISVSGKRIANRCGIVSLRSMSSHMQYNQLLEYLSAINTPKIVLVHGDKAKMDFAKVLQDKINEKNMTGRVICSQKGYTLTV